uniref:zinc finger protein 22-like isoform X4 n=1 Tax=Doryrhamphus excisus TaxID=161450 RepID=UPI0025AE2FC5|nr:zinc finger protein 22-like isoform X4 [Doryrhamphus excisus]
MCERTIEYEEELSPTKMVNEKELLDAVFKPRVDFNTSEVSDEQLATDHWPWRSRVEQEEPRPPHIKEEEEEPRPPHIKEEEEEYSISQEGGHLEEGQVIRVIVKSEDEDDEDESEEMRETEPPGSSGYRCGGPQGGSLLAPLSDSEDVTSNSADSDDGVPKAAMTCHPDSSRWKCSQCKKCFYDSSTLKRHMACHSDNTHWKCDECDKTFKQKSNLKRHMRYHTGEKPFICSECDERFYEKAHLIAHTKRHNGEKAFPCSVCGKRFYEKARMMVHIRTHTGEKPYSCSICGSFATLG